MLKKSRKNEGVKREEIEMAKGASRFGTIIFLLVELFFSTGLFAVPAQDTISVKKENILSVPVVYRPDSLIRDTLAYEYTRIKKRPINLLLQNELDKN